MFTVYVYVMDTLADWEIGHVTAELLSVGATVAKQNSKTQAGSLPSCLC